MFRNYEDRFGALNLTLLLRWPIFFQQTAPRPPSSCYGGPPLAPLTLSMEVLN